jgi:predicted glutamine amidotransferase
MEIITAVTSTEAVKRILENLGLPSDPPAFHSARPPPQTELGEAMQANDDAHLAIVATEPLARGETWQKAAPGTLWVFGEGRLLSTFAPGD